MEQKQVIDELNYHRAQTITELLYRRNLITFEEYDRLTLMNRDTFSPVMAELLPKPQKKTPVVEDPETDDCGEVI